MSLYFQFITLLSSCQENFTLMSNFRLTFPLF
nr:MAG TPA: hypothetical protein [Caudoviricetes sp.]